MTDVNRGRDIKLALQPVIASYQLFDISVPKSSVAQRFRSANGLPPNSNAGIGETLSQRLFTQRPPSRLAVCRDQLAALVRRIEIRANDVRVEKGGVSRSDQHGNLAEWVLREDDLVALRGARLLVDDFDEIGDARFVCEHENLAREGRMRLIQQFHGVVSLPSYKC
jgi:hypothetical protein